MNSSDSVATSTQSFSPRHRRGSALLDNERWLGPLLLGPAVLYIVLLVGVPFLMALYYSVSNTTTGGGTMDFSVSAVIYLALAASAMGFGYAAWNVGILHGNVTVLATASYFIPVFSAALAAVLLHAPLSFAFWKGALMVVAGSILCWLATRGGRAKTLSSPKSSA